MIMFYTKSCFLEIGVFSLLMIFLKYHSLTDNIQVEQKKTRKR